MNDNQRFISLEYIKGNNYQEITCFDYETLKAELDQLINANQGKTFENIVINNSEDLLNKLNNALEDDKCKIGESLINDLVNYYNFKDIRGLIKQALLYTQRYNEIKRDNIYNEKKYDNKNLIEKLHKLKELIEGNDANSIIEFFPDIISYLKTNEKIHHSEAKNLIDENFIKKNIEEATNREEIKKYLLTYILTHLEASNNSHVSYDDTYKMMNKIHNYLPLLLDILNKIDKLTNKDSQKEKKNLENIIKLYRYYLKLCNINITKYENIFKKNEISNIDDAFMIESYSKFLKKLKILKENLESKDEGKLKRLLINSLNKLFILYGIDPNKALGINDVNYMKEYILYS
jgi:hypothetical protein